MAPNRKHISLLSVQLADLKVVRSKDQVYQPQKPVVESASYWEWSASEVEPSDLFSADHIEANLVKAASTVESKSVTNASADDYWSESNQDDEQDTLAAMPSSPQQQVESSVDYWRETSQQRTESDNYWSTDSVLPPSTIRTDSVVPPSTIRSTAVNPSESAAYWQEQTHVSATDCTNNYWAESRPSESSDGDYWQWSASVRPESDNYWQWSSVTVA
jgi:hypothetical protein